MAHNPVENYFLAEAIKTLRPRYEAVYGHVNGTFYLSRAGPRFMVIGDGRDKGKLTVAKLKDGTYIPDPAIEPVDYCNLLFPGESVASAVLRVLEEKRASKTDNESNVASLPSLEDAIP